MRVKKFSKDLPDLKMLEKGDWVDLYVNSILVTQNNQKLIQETQDNPTDLFLTNDIVHYKQGDVIIVGLGLAIELPENNEAEVRSRSSTFKQTGLLLTNSVGTIDESYKGDKDQWMGMFYATRDGHVKRFDRLLQFKVSQKMIKPNVEYVEHLGNENRGGYGTTGK